MCCLTVVLYKLWEGFRRNLEAELAYLYNLLIVLLIFELPFRFIVNVVSHDYVMHIPTFEI